MFDRVAEIASIVGAGFSIWAVVAATGARSAARDARRNVHRRSASDDFDRLSRLAKEWLALVEDRRYPLAAARARDLVADLAVASKRWERFLESAEADRLSLAREQVSIALRRLATGREPSEGEDAELLSEIARRVLLSLAEQSGELIARMEREEE